MLSNSYVKVSLGIFPKLTSSQHASKGPHSGVIWTFLRGGGWYANPSPPGTSLGRICIRHRPLDFRKLFKSLSIANAQDTNGTTPLHCALESESFPMHSQLKDPFISTNMTQRSRDPIQGLS